MKALFTKVSVQGHPCRNESYSDFIEVTESPCILYVSFLYLFLSPAYIYASLSLSIPFLFLSILPPVFKSIQTFDSESGFRIMIIQFFHLLFILSFTLVTMEGQDWYKAFYHFLKQFCGTFKQFYSTRMFTLLANYYFLKHKVVYNNTFTVSLLHTVSHLHRNVH